MSKTKVQKQQLVQEITDKLAKSKSVVFADYQGLTMAQLADMRNKLSETGSELEVTKNTLLKLALENNKLAVLDDSAISGATATLYAYEDEIAPLKELTKALNEAQIGSVKGAFLNGEFLNKDQAIQLSTLPGKDELRGGIVGAIGGPLYGVVGVLQANLRNFVYVLEQYRKMKGGE
jgi:large subunit ribosomal protein L10